MVIRLFLSGILALIPIANADAANLSDVAKRFSPAFSWDEKSVLVADFSCAGHQEKAILGKSKSGIAVAFFLDGPNRQPEIFSFPVMPEVQDAVPTFDMSLSLEGLTTTDKEWNYMLGGTPEGYEQSSSCKGLSLSGGDVDSFHFYFNHVSKRMEWWRL